MTDANSNARQADAEAATEQDRQSVPGKAHGADVYAPGTRGVEQRSQEPTADPAEFEVALRQAIKASGLSLDRIRYRLAQRGTPVSLATLSYWQSGRSRPERPDSIRAVRVLEQVLGLSDRGLLDLLGPPRPRGRWAGRSAPLGLGDVFPDQDVLAKTLHESGIGPTLPVRRLSVHDDHVLGPDRKEERTTVRQVLRAEADGVDRCLAIYFSDEPGSELPEVAYTKFCRIGRVSRGDGFLLAELLLDRTLMTGETAVVEYELDLTSVGVPVNGYHRRFRQGTREYVLTVRFHPDALPERCYEYAQSSLDSPPKQIRDVPACDGMAHLVALDCGPGIRGLGWTWPS